MSVTTDIKPHVSTIVCDAVSVPTTGNTTLAELDLRGFPQRKWLWLSVNTDATAVIDAFAVNVKVVYEETAYAPYISGTDWDTATDNMKFCSGTGPQELGAAATAIARIYVGGLEAVQLTASTSTLGSVTVYATLSN